MLCPLVFIRLTLLTSESLGSVLLMKMYVDIDVCDGGDDDVMMMMMMMRRRRRRRRRRTMMIMEMMVVVVMMTKNFMFTTMTQVIGNDKRLTLLRFIIITNLSNISNNVQIS